MKKIQFVKELSDAIIPTDLPDDSYIIHHSDYNPPDIKNIKGKIEFEEFKKIYTNLHANYFIFYGLNKIITPSNRTDFIFEFLFTLSADIPKISVDYKPFNGEPWRLWFHYGLCKCGNFGIPYSYSIETEWKHWFYRENNTSRFESNNLGICVTDTYSNLDQLKYSVDFEDVDENILTWYEEVKKFVFEKYDTPKLLISNMLKLSNDKFKIKYNMDSYLESKMFELPDLPIYRFVDEENVRRLNIYNKIVEVGKNT